MVTCRGILAGLSHCAAWRAGSNFEQQSDKDKRADFSKLGLTGYSGDKVISQRDIQRLVSSASLGYVQSSDSGVQMSDCAGRLPFTGFWKPFILC